MPKTPKTICQPKITFLQIWDGFWTHLGWIWVDFFVDWWCNPSVKRQHHDTTNDETTEQRSDERGNTKTTPSFGKSFLRTGGMRACVLNPPPPSWGNTACQSSNSKPNLIPNSFPNFQVLEPPIVTHWLRTFRRADPKLGFERPLALPSWIFSSFFCQFFADRKFIKNRTPQKLLQNLKIPPLGAQGSIFDQFWSHVGIHLHENPETVETS